jgi:hypothetical protein
MESATITSWPELERRVRTTEGSVTRLEVKQEATTEDVKQINERLDRAAKAAYFLGSAFLALSGTIIGTVLAG